MRPNQLKEWVDEWCKKEGVSLSIEASISGLDGLWEFLADKLTVWHREQKEIENTDDEFIKNMESKL